MSKYLELRNNPPKLTVKEGAREVIFKTISTMCDNVGHLKFKKNEEGDFKMSGNGFSLSNWQFKHQVYEIEWEADENMWGGVIAMINSGTAVIESVSSR
jgi:ribose 1,5-bisphosphokinase PhnN